MAVVWMSHSIIDLTVKSGLGCKMRMNTDAALKM